MNITIKDMDKINYLLTEVSLELLGNKFYNIYGENCKFLKDLIGTDINTFDNYTELECDLVKTLEIEEFISDVTINTTQNNTQEKQQQQHTKVQQQINYKKDSPSSSTIRQEKIPAPASNTVSTTSSSIVIDNDNDNDNDNDLLIIDNKKTKYVNDADRRKQNKNLVEKLKYGGGVGTKKSSATQNESTAAVKTRKIKALTRAKRGESIDFKHHGFSKDVESSKIIRIKNAIDEVYKRMMQESKTARERYFVTNQSRMDTDYLDEYDIIQQFENEEKNALIVESNSLIEFIKFVKCDPQNSERMTDIANHILQVKNQI